MNDYDNKKPHVHIYKFNGFKHVNIPSRNKAPAHHKDYLYRCVGKGCGAYTEYCSGYQTWAGS